MAETLEVFVRKTLEDVQISAVEAMNRSTLNAANLARTWLKNNSPFEYGDYSAGWRVKREGTSPLSPYKYTVHNKTRWMLTHLLENGHWNHMTGRFTPGIPHIRTARDMAEEKALELRFDP